MSSSLSESERLKARISLHEQYTIAETDWFEWILERVKLPTHGLVLDVGCGTGELWKRALPKLASGVQLCLIDKSEDMLGAADKVLSDRGPDVSFQQANATELPQERDSVDLLFCNQVLMFLEQPREGLQEFHRVLRPGGTLCVATNGRNHMLEIMELMREFKLPVIADYLQGPARSSLEVTGGQLAQLFPHVELHRFPARIEVKEVAALIAYIKSLDLEPGNHEAIYHRVEEEIGRIIKEQGSFLIKKSMGLFLARKSR